MRFAIPLLTLLLTPMLYATASEVISTQTFANDTGNAAAYQGNELLESVSDGGSSFLRATLPGQKALEGVRIPLGSVEGNRLLVVKVKLRGKGTVGPMIQATNGWTRLAPLPLTEEWQEVTIPKTLQAGANHPTVYFVTLPKDEVQQGAVFEIANLEVVLEEPAAVDSHEVPAARYEAEDFAVMPAHVGTGQDAKGIVSQASSMTQPFPFPQTSEKVTIYARYFPTSERDRLQLSTLHGGAGQIVREVNPAGPGWQWIALRGLTAGEVGEEVRLVFWPATGATEPAILDAFVITTDDTMDDAALDALR